MRYFLDSNTCIYARKLQAWVVERMREHLPSEIDPFDVLPFDRVAADTYAQVRFDLEQIGRRPSASGTC